MRRHAPKTARASARVVAKTLGGRRHFPKTGRAKTRVVAKTRGRAKTFPEDRLCEDARRREDTWAGEDTSRRQAGRRPASSRRHEGVRRHLAKTGEHAHRRKNTWATRRATTAATARGSVFRTAGDVSSFVASCNQIHAKCCARWHSYMPESFPGVSAHNLVSKPWRGAPPRARSRAHARTRRIHSGVGNVSSQIQHLRGIAPSSVQSALLAHVAPGSQREQGGVARCRQNVM